MANAAYEIQVVSDLLISFVCLIGFVAREILGVVLFLTHMPDSQTSWKLNISLSVGYRVTWDNEEVDAIEG